jgi:hypothetical protein
MMQQPATRSGRAPIEDLDDHVFELVWMNPEAMPGNNAEPARTERK